MENFDEILENLKILIETGRELQILEQMARLHSADVADLIERLDDDKKTQLFRLLDVKTASEVIIELDDISRELILEGTPSDSLVQMLDEMETDDAADLLGELPQEDAQVVLEQISPESKEDVASLLKYDEDSAGGIMQTELIKVRPDYTIKMAIDTISDQKDEVEEIHNVFVADDDDRLMGVVSPWDLFLDPKPDNVVNEIMEPAEIFAYVDMDQEEVAKAFAKYDVISLPVIDQGHRLLGRITIDDIVDVLDEEASEDIYSIAGAGDEEDILSRSLVDNLKARAPWLMFSMFAGLLMVSIIKHFDGLIESIIALAIFFPAIMASGGNVALQSAVIGVRGLATGSISPKDLGRQIVRETRLAVALSFLYVLILGSMVIILFPGHLMLLVTVCVAVLINTVLAALVGISTPIIFKQIKIDPAVSTSPLVTSLMDVLGLMIYFITAKILLF